jgi:hypothetical protein
MKITNLYTTLLLAAAGILLGSCTDMDQYPEDKLSPETYFSTETELALYTNQFYSMIPSVSADYNWYLEQGEHIVTPTLSREILGTRIIPSDAGDVGWTWTQLRKINYYLKYSSRCTDTATRNHYDGVAYFFRAYFYYDKLKKFGEVPWYDEPIGSDDEAMLRKTRDSREVIINHIIDDCNKADSLLPVNP